MQAVEECIHGLEYGCTLCSGKADPTPQQEHPVYKFRKPKPHKDAAITLAEQVARGIICGVCASPTEGGCWCVRRDFYADNQHTVRIWLHRHVEANCLDGKTGAGLAFANTTRMARRAGILEEDAAADRLEIVDTFEVEPRWQPYRRTEANPLPV